MAKDKKDKKDKKDRKEKKHKHKKEKRRESSSDTDEDDKRKRVEKLSEKVVKNLQKHPSTAGEPRFVWKKKIEHELMSGKDVRDLTAKAERKRQLERAEEIEKVKKRREERELQRAQVEEEMNMLQRERAMAEAALLEKKEEEFHLEQAKLRAQQRLREGRAKPIDLVAKNLHLGDDFDLEIEEPYTIFKGMMLSDIRDLKSDIQMYQELDMKDPEHVRFWSAMMIVCDHELKEAELQEEKDRARLRGEPLPASVVMRDRGLHSTVAADVQSMLSGKSAAELDELEADIRSQLESGAAGEPEYWSSVLHHLRIHKAKAELREVHRSLMQRHLDALQMQEERVDVAKEMGWAQEDEVPAQPAEQEPSEESASPSPASSPEPEAAPAAVAAVEEQVEEEEDVEDGRWSPEPVVAEAVVGQDVVNEEDDWRLIELLRAQYQYKEAQRFRSVAAAGGSGAGGYNDAADRAYQQMVSDPSNAMGGVHPMMRFLADAAPQEGEMAMRAGRHALDVDEDNGTQQFRAVANRMMGDLSTSGDAPFGGEINLDSQVYWWHEKYKPRKPKYFNRVHTGYEWNKYNQTHYDHDNPPPKVVQGYKFNIFYPDLIDKTNAPTYHLEKDTAGDGQTCVLRFHAGPPYEDIAFRIVNKEWEYSHKKGYKCTFERGILHLYFNFKRTRYRR